MGLSFHNYSQSNWTSSYAAANYAAAASTTPLSCRNFTRVKGNRVHVNEQGKIYVRSKTPAEVVGERLIQPIVNKVSGIFSSIWNFSAKVVHAIAPVKEPKKLAGTGCSTKIVLGAVGTVVTKSPVPIVAATMSCLATPVSAQEHRFEDDVQELMDKKEFTFVLKRCEQLIEEGKDTAKIYYLKGMALKNLGALEEAITSFNKGSEKDSKYWNDSERKELINLTRNPDALKKYRNEFHKKINNNVPTHLEYGMMSALVRDHEIIEEMECANNDPYGTPCVELSSSESEFIKYRLYLTNRNWGIFITSAKLNISKNGYFGVAFKHKDTDLIVIAHRGWGAKDYSNLEQDIAQLSQEGFQLEQANEFTNEVAKRCKDCAISHAGTSFGSVLAEILAYQRYEVAVTYDSPGSKLKLLNKYNLNEQSNPFIVTYMSDPNRGNTYGLQVGHCRRISPIIPKDSFITQAADVLLGNEKSHLERLDRQFHNIVHLLGAFDHETGNPKTYRSVTLWPHGEENRKFYYHLTNRALGEESTLHDNVQRQLHTVYRTSLPNPLRMSLSQFSIEAQHIIRECNQGEKYYSNLSRHLLMLYQVEGDEVVMRSDPEIFSVQEFENYIMHKVVEIRRKELPILKATPFTDCWVQDSTNVAVKSREYEIFFNLPFVRNLFSNEIPNLKTYLDQKKRADWDAVIKVSRAKTFMKEDEFLAEFNKKLIEGGHKYQFEGISRYYKYGTLIGELFNNHNKGIHDFLSVINNEPSFFVGKSLEIIENGVSRYSGEIESFSRSDMNLYFILKGRSRVVIHTGSSCKRHTAVITEQSRQPLLDFLEDYIVNGNISKQFILELNQNGQFPSWIKGGRYELGQKRELQYIKNKIRTLELFALDLNAYFEIEYSYVKGSSEPSQVFLWQVQQNERKEKIDLRFNARYIKSIYTKTRSISVEHQNVNQQLFIRDFIPNHRAENIEKIDQLFGELVTLLWEEEYHTLVESSLSHLIDNKLFTFNNSSLIDSAPRVKTRLQDLVVLKNSPEINEPETREEIFLRAILEFNYQNIAKAVDGMDVSKAMELFAIANQHIEKIQDKHIILFVSKTGAGKSLSICSMQGNTITPIEHSYYQKIYNCTSTNGLPSPKIGLSITDSETSHVEGFPTLDDNDLVLCDAPGLKDTRGDDREITAALSIDQAIQRARSIRAVVVTIPYNELLDEKGGQVIELIRIVADLIPDIYENKGNGVFILVTKHGSFGDDDLNKIIQIHAGGSTNDDIDSGRKRIWELIRSMHNEGRVSRIDIENEMRSLELLSQYKKSPGLERTAFETMMQTDLIKTKFANKIQSAATTWTNIFKKYQLDIPGAILNHENKIKLLQAKLNSAEESIKNNTLNIEQLTKNEVTIKSKQEKLKKINQATPEQELDPILANELRSQGEKIEKDIRESQIGRIDAIKKICSDLLKEIGEIKVSIGKMGSEKQKLEEEIKLKEEGIKKLSEGDEDEELYGYHPQANDQEEVCTLKDGIREQRMKEKRGHRNEDCVEGSSRKEKNSDRTGGYRMDFELEREYWIAPPPDKPHLQKEFEEKGFVQSGNRNYKATIDGKHFYLDHRAVLPSGKKVVYYLTLDYLKERNELPFFNVTHKTPKIERYHTEIGTFENAKNVAVDALNKLIPQLQKLKTDLVDNKNKLKDKKIKILEVEKELKATELKQIQHGIAPVMQANEQLLKEIKKRIQELNTGNEDLRIQKRKNAAEIEGLQKESLNLKKEQRNLAIVIKTRWHVAKALYVFTGIADKNVKYKHYFRDTCDAYRKIYEEHADEIYASVLA